MARKIDSTSVRQQSFKLLTNNSTTARHELLDRLMVDFDIKLSYAKTLYQDWRRQSKEAGILTEVFSVRDHKDGITVDPYLFTRYTSNPDATDATSVKDAVKVYVKDLVGRTNKAMKL